MSNIPRKRTDFRECNYSCKRGPSVDIFEMPHAEATECARVNRTYHTTIILYRGRKQRGELRHALSQQRITARKVTRHAAATAGASSTTAINTANYLQKNKRKLQH